MSKALMCESLRLEGYKAYKFIRGYTDPDQSAGARLHRDFC